MRQDAPRRPRTVMENPPDLVNRLQHKVGSVVLDARRKTWNFLFCENGKRRTKTIGSLRDFPTKASAWSAVETIKRNIQPVQPAPSTVLTVRAVVAPKSKVHIRTAISALWDYAMWRGDVPTERNPMELVTIKGASKRNRKPRSLTVEEFQKFLAHLDEPFRTMALVCVCFGLRISECLGLKWSDVDWLNGKISIQRGIVREHEDTVDHILRATDGGRS